MTRTALVARAGCHIWVDAVLGPSKSIPSPYTSGVLVGMVALYLLG
jgi:hypothetical protein